MKQNNTFSLSRLWMLIRWDFGTNWKVYTWRYLGLYLAFLALMMIALGISDSVTPNIRNIIQSSSMVCVLAFVLLSFRSASLVMERMITKEGWTTFLMLPASKVEKFVWRAFFASVFYLLMGIVAFALADLTFYLLCLALDKGDGVTPFLYFGNYMENLVHMLFDYVPLGLPDWPYWIQSFGYLLFSVFLLGGCAWRRLAGLRICAALLLIAWGTPELLNRFAPEGLSAIYFSADWVNGACCVLAILCWFLAYRFFSRSQVM